MLTLEDIAKDLKCDVRVVKRKFVVPKPKKGKPEVPGVNAGKMRCVRVGRLVRVEEAVFADWKRKNTVYETPEYAMVAKSMKALFPGRLDTVTDDQLSRFGRKRKTA